MQTQNHYLDDAASFVSSTISIVSSIREEIEKLVIQKLEKVLVRLDLVSRDEIDVLHAMLRVTRSSQGHLERRLAVLESSLVRGKRYRLPRRQAVTNLHHRIHR